jgi:hypothetical protein
VRLGVPALLPLPLGVGVAVEEELCDPVLLCDWLVEGEREYVGICVWLGVPSLLSLPLGVGVAEGMRVMF